MRPRLRRVSRPAFGSSRCRGGWSSGCSATATRTATAAPLSGSTCSSTSAASPATGGQPAAGTRAATRSASGATTTPTGNGRTASTAAGYVYARSTLAAPCSPGRTAYVRTPSPTAEAGRFVDLRTLAFALTDRSHTLETACTAFGDPYEKADVDYSKLTPTLIGYALDDVRHTATLYRNCLAELRHHPGIELEPQRLYSPATVGSCYLDAMGVRRPLVKYTDLTGLELGWDDPAELKWGRRPRIPPDELRGDLDPRVLGWAMSAFYGGRAEARIVRTSVPVALVDFTSMYPSVNALLGTWPLLTANRLRARKVTRDVRALLADPKLLSAASPASSGPRSASPSSSSNPTGRSCPHVPATTRPRTTSASASTRSTTRAASGTRSPTSSPPSSFRHLVPAACECCERYGSSPSASSRASTQVRLRDGELIDPAVDDPFVRMIEARQRILRDPSFEDEERGRLERFLKITANATSYGVLARFDRRERDKPVELTVYGPDDDSSAVSENAGGPRAVLLPADRRLDHCRRPADARPARTPRHTTTAATTHSATPTRWRSSPAKPAAPLPCPTSGGDRITALPWSTMRTILDRFEPSTRMTQSSSHPPGRSRPTA